MPNRSNGERHPGPWGPEDRLGAGNYLGPAKVLEALALVREGEILDLSLPIGVNSPRIPGINSPLVMSMWSHPLMSAIVHRGRGTKNGVAFADERIEFDTHTGTHIDALGHTSANGRMYNGVSVEEAATNHGLTDLDATRIPPMITRGVLLDVVRLKGRFLNAGEPVTPDDLMAAAEAAGGIAAGDMAFVRTGWARHYGVDNARYVGPAPGITEAAAVWLADQQVAAVGGDTMSIEVTPFEDPENSDPVHLHLLVRRGVYMIEQINLERPELAAHPVFCCCCLAPPFAGATGSPLRLVAVV